MQILCYVTRYDNCGTDSSLRYNLNSITDLFVFQLLLSHVQGFPTKASEAAVPGTELQELKRY